jgi:hypothetical protein
MRGARIRMGFLLTFFLRVNCMQSPGDTALVAERWF